MPLGCSGSECLCLISSGLSGFVFGFGRTQSEVFQRHSGSQVDQERLVGSGLGVGLVKGGGTDASLARRPRELLRNHATS